MGGNESEMFERLCVWPGGEQVSKGASGPPSHGLSKLCKWRIPNMVYGNASAFTGVQSQECLVHDDSKNAPNCLLHLQK